MVIDKSIEKNFICNFQLHEVVNCISTWIANNAVVSGDKAYSFDVTGFTEKAEKGYFNSNRVIYAGLMVFQIALEYEIEVQYRDVSLDEIASKYELEKMEKCMGELNLKESICFLYKKVKNIIC